MDRLLHELIDQAPSGAVAVEQVHAGPYLTAVRVAGRRTLGGVELPRCGLSSSLSRYQHSREQRVQGVGGLHLLDARELAARLHAPNPMEASLGMAALNALLELPDRCYDPALSALDAVAERAGRVAVVGRFPFVERLRQRVDELQVLELMPLGDDVPASRAAELLPRADAVIVTATVLMNGTWRELLPLCERPFAVMMGPSTPACPLLFEYGIDVLAGSTIVDAESVIRCVSQGACYRDLEGMEKWTWIRG